MFFCPVVRATGRNPYCPGCRKGNLESQWCGQQAVTPNEVQPRMHEQRETSSSVISLSCKPLHLLLLFSSWSFLKSCPCTFLLLFSSSPIEGLLADTMNTIILLSNQHSTFTYRIASDPYQEILLSPFSRGR